MYHVRVDYGCDYLPPALAEQCYAAEYVKIYRDISQTSFFSFVCAVFQQSIQSIFFLSLVIHWMKWLEYNTSFSTISQYNITEEPLLIPFFIFFFQCKRLLIVLFVRLIFSITNFIFLVFPLLEERTPHPRMLEFLFRGFIDFLFCDFVSYGFWETLDNTKLWSGRLSLSSSRTGHARYCGNDRTVLFLWCIDVQFCHSSRCHCQWETEQTSWDSACHGTQSVSIHFKNTFFYIYTYSFLWFNVYEVLIQLS